jgi:hypothetical protein
MVSLPFASAIQDHREGQWRVRFELGELARKLGDENLDRWFEANILPLLTEQHQLRGESAAGPTVRFHRDADDPRDWECRWRFTRRDEHGEEVIGPDGKKEKVSFQYQVQRIANGVVERANRLIAEALGVAVKEPVIAV